MIMIMNHLVCHFLIVKIMIIDLMIQKDISLMKIVQKRLMLNKKKKI